MAPTTGFLIDTYSQDEQGYEKYNRILHDFVGTPSENDDMFFPIDELEEYNQLRAFLFEGEKHFSSVSSVAGLPTMWIDIICKRHKSM